MAENSEKQNLILYDHEKNVNQLVHQTGVNALIKKEEIHNASSATPLPKVPPG